MRKAVQFARRFYKSSELAVSDFSDGGGGRGPYEGLFVYEGGTEAVIAINTQGRARRISFPHP